jgi:hypothetical protein
VTSPPDSAPVSRVSRAPALLMAAGVVVVEALTLLGVGVSVVVGSDSRRLLLDVTTTLFFLFYGGALLLCAWGLAQTRRWARAPVVLAQLIQILVSWSFFSGATRWVAVLMAATAVGVLASVLSPSATRVLVDDETG